MHLSGHHTPSFFCGPPLQQSWHSCKETARVTISTAPCPPPRLTPSHSSHTDKTHVFFLPLISSELWIMETAVNELRKCNAEGNKWKTSGPPQDGAEWPSSMRPPARGDSWPTKIWRRADNFLPSFMKAFLKCAYVHINQVLKSLEVLPNISPRNWRAQ